MLSAAGRGLYYGNRQERSGKPLKRYSELSESNISLLTRIFSNAPPNDLISTSPRHEAYTRITHELIEALPAVLITPPSNKHFFGLISSKNDRCLVRDPRKPDGRPFKELCHLHSRLQCPLIHSILRFVLDEISWYMPKLFDLPFQSEHRLLFDRLVNVTSLYMRPSDFEERWGRPPPSQWARQSNKCAACMLARIGSDAEALVALSAIYRARIREETYDFHLRTFWYEEWMRSTDTCDGEYLVEKSHALGNAMGRVIRKAKKEAEKLDEINPDVSWAKKKPSPAQPSPACQHRQHVSAEKDAHMNAPEHVPAKLRFSDEEALAKLSGTWVPPKRRPSNLSAHAAFDHRDTKCRSISSTGSATLVDDDYMDIERPNEIEKVYAYYTHVHQPTYTNTPAATYTTSFHATFGNAMPESSMAAESGNYQGLVATPERETIFVDSTQSGSLEAKPRTGSAAFDWVDVCARMNKMAIPTDDIPGLSDCSTARTSEVSSCDGSIPTTPLFEAIDCAYVDDDKDDDDDEKDCPETQRYVPHIRLPSGSPSEKERAVIPDTFVQPAEHDLHPQPSMNTVSSGSVYSFYEGPYGERYNMPLPPPPKPLHIRKTSDDHRPVRTTPRQESFILAAPLMRPDLKATATDPTSESWLRNGTHRRTASFSNKQLYASGHASTARGSLYPQSASRPPSAPPVMRSGMAIGGSEFRRMLRTPDEENYADDRRSEWMRQFEWEQPHPATSRIFY